MPLWPLPLGVPWPTRPLAPEAGVRLELLRFSSRGTSTTGALFERVGNKRFFLCFTLEDEARATKMPGRTRIPAGTYPVELRREGGFHARYAARFPAFHLGMLWLKDVPGFQWILLHLGNEPKDTEGCILLADAAYPQEDRLTMSQAAYRRVYPPIARRIDAGETALLEIIDYDTPPSGG
jgi:hypothetical protein